MRSNQSWMPAPARSWHCQQKVAEKNRVAAAINQMPTPKLVGRRSAAILNITWRGSHGLARRRDIRRPFCPCPATVTISRFSAVHFGRLEFDLRYHHMWLMAEISLPDQDQRTTLFMGPSSYRRSVLLDGGLRPGEPLPQYGNKHQWDQGGGCRWKFQRQGPFHSSTLRSVHHRAG